MASFSSTGRIKDYQRMQDSIVSVTDSLPGGLYRLEVMDSKPNKKVFTFQLYYLLALSYTLQS